MLLRSPRLLGVIRHASTTTNKSPTAVKPSSKAPLALHPPRLPELASLPAATSRLTFASLPYGSPPAHLFPPSTPHHHTHHTPYFTLRCFPSPHRTPLAYPHARSPLLDSPAPPPSVEHTTSSSNPLQPFLRAEEMREQLRKGKDGKKAWRMELTLLVSKKKVHKSAVVRNDCKRRFREAVRLVVLRGARKGEDGGVDCREEWREEGARRWLMPGYSYVASIPSLEIYRCSFPALVETMRTALKSLKTKAINAKLQHELSLIPEPPADLTPEELAQKPPSSVVEAVEDVQGG